MEEKLTCFPSKYSLTTPHMTGDITQHSPRCKIPWERTQVGVCKLRRKAGSEFDNRCIWKALDQCFSGLDQCYPLGGMLNTSGWRALSFPLFCSLSPHLFICIFYTLIYCLMSYFSANNNTVFSANEHQAQTNGSV